jgi:iron complex outermembrane receptor protein
MQKKYYFICFFLMFCGYSFSQNTISGTIFNPEKLPLVDAHIHIGSRKVSSDASGFYSMSKVPSKTIKIHVSYVGYQSIDTLVTVNASSNLNFTLKVNTNQLDEVVVAQTGNTLNKSVLEQKIKAETIEKYSSNSLGDALKEITGVSTLKTGSTVVKPVINGLYGSRVPIINHNVRLEDQQWGTEHAPNFDINSAGKITVVKGASGLQYGGDAVGGLVIIEPLSIRKDTLFGKTILTLDSNGKGGALTSSIHKGNTLGWSWNALGTFKYFGDRSAPEYVLSNTGNREADFSGDVKFAGRKYSIAAFYSYYNANIGILSASHTGNVNDLYNSINNKVPSVVNDFTYSIRSPRQKVQHHIAKLNYNYYFNETASIAVQYAFQYNKRLEFDIRRGDFKDKAALDLELSSHAVNIDYKKQLHDWSIKSGVSTSVQSNFANPATGVRPLIPNFDKTDLGVYGILSHNFMEDLTMEVGGRYDFSQMQASKFYLKTRWDERGYDQDFSDFIVADFGTQWLTKPSFTFHNVSASIGIHKMFEKKWDWYLNLSAASRNPNPSELFSDGLHHSTGVIELGDLRLSKENALKLSTTIQKRGALFSLEINPYLSRIENYMFLKPIGFETTIRGAFPVWEYQQTLATIAGVDVQTRWDITNQWQHVFSFSYVKGRDLVKKEYLIDIPPLTFNNKIHYSKKEWHDLVLELKSEWVMHQNQYPDNNFTTNIIVDNQLVPVEVDISTPPPAYHLLHFYSQMKFKTFQKGITTVAFSVQNILNTNYRDYLNRQRFFADEMGRNFQIQLKFNY